MCKLIRNLTVVVPKQIVSRDGYEPERLAHFERLTGIKKTRRFSGTPAEFLKAGIGLFGKILPQIPYYKGIILVTQTPSRLSPANAMDLLPLSSNRDIPVFDVNQSCDGFIYGLKLANSLAEYEHDTFLVVCMDMLRFENGTEESLIFSDAISFCMVRPLGWGKFRFLNNDEGKEILCAGTDGKMKMDGGAVFDFVTRNVPRMISDYVEHNWKFDALVQHQANLSMMNLVVKRSGFEGEHLTSIEEYGNQSMVSIPCTLAANEEKILGKRVLICGYGAGYSAAITGLPKWSDKPVSRILEV